MSENNEGAQAAPERPQTTERPQTDRPHGGERSYGPRREGGGGRSGGYRGGGDRDGGGRGERRGGPGGRRRFGRGKVCQMCVDKVTYVDYKDIRRLRRYVTERGKVVSRRISGACSKHQRAVTRAIHRARFLALLPYKS